MTHRCDVIDCLCVQLQGAEPDRPTGRLADSEQVEVDGESYLTRLYGRAPYEGVRRTLKKSPYLRFSSPGSPLSRKPRPRLLESVRGQKLFLTDVVITRPDLNCPIRAEYYELSSDTVVQVCHFLFPVGLHQVWRWSPARLRRVWLLPAVCYLDHLSVMT